MSVKNREIKDAVRQLANTFGKSYLKVQVCNVDAVSESDFTCDCTPISGDIDVQIAGVLLNSEPNAGFTLIPAVDSTVIVAVSDFDNLPFVLMFEEIDKVLITIGNTTLVVQDGLTTFNGGGNDGLILVNPMVSRMNKIEKRVNDVTEAINTLTLPVSGSTAGPPVPIPFTDTLILTQKSDIENTAIKQ